GDDFGRALRQFDYDTIPDAIVHVKYTAREDAGAFKSRALGHLRDYFASEEPAHGVLAIDLRRELPSQWSRFLAPSDPEAGNVFELAMSSDRFPLRDAGKPLQITEIRVLARCADPADYGVTLVPPLAEDAAEIPIIRVHKFGDLHTAPLDVSGDGIAIAPGDPPVAWRLRFTRPGGGDLIEDPVTHA